MSAEWCLRESQWPHYFAEDMLRITCAFCRADSFPCPRMKLATLTDLAEAEPEIEG
jgi:hypothetical protein